MSQIRYYAGIGSRQTPPEILALMTRTAAWLRTLGFILRSGHATGADWAFEQGAREDSVIYLPWPTFGQQPYSNDPGRPVLGEAVCHQDEWLSNAQQLSRDGIYHARTRTLSLLHGRNYAQICGLQGDPPSNFVLCYTSQADHPNAGGTTMAVRLARKLNIPVYNLWDPADRKLIESRLPVSAE